MVRLGSPFSVAFLIPLHPHEIPDRKVGSKALSIPPPGTYCDTTSLLLAALIERLRRDLALLAPNCHAELPFSPRREELARDIYCSLTVRTWHVKIGNSDNMRNYQQ